MNKKQKKILKRIGISFALVIVIILCTEVFFDFEKLKYGFVIELLLFLVPYFVIGYDILIKAGKGILNRQPFDECFLMAVATIGAIALGEYLEGVAVMLFYQIGEFFQSYAIAKSRKNITQMMDMRPDYANIYNDNKEIEQIDPDDVEVGTVIVIRPGEKVPIDGVVISGGGRIDTRALTGESIPRSIDSGDEIISGSISLDTVLEVRTTKEFGESTVSKILELVSEASSNKSKSEDFISKFARVYTPIVCFLAMALAVGAPLIRILILGIDGAWSTWVMRALTFLVISCPCALVISIPLSFFAGIGGASHEGILIKGSNYLETLSKIKTVVFDKTGTLTMGVFEVIGVHHSPLTEAKLLEYAAYAENSSTHPIARSIVDSYGKKIDTARIAEVRELSGMGVIAIVDDMTICCGNSKLMNEVGVKFSPCHEIGTVVHVSIDKQYMGHILIADRMKEGAATLVEKLKNMGIKKTVMLTGDSRETSMRIAGEVKVDEWFSELLPIDKVSKVEEFQNDGSKLAFVGDGINDAPVLVRADIGIAMGALGSDAAIEAADVVLMDDNPSKIIEAIRIAKKTLRIVYENIYFAIGVKVLCLVLGALGIANMWAAIFADVGVMVIAVLNALRALRI